MSDKAARFDEVYRLVMTGLRPEPVAFYKPKRSGDGVAAKFNLRLRPEYGQGEEGEAEFVKDVEGGLFVDLVAQGAANAAGFPTFKWTDKATLVTAKLGLPDISALLVSIRDFRERGIEVPTYLRGKPRAGEAQAAANAVSLFHKTDATNTVITYTFEPESSILAISKSRELRKSVSLTLGEEVILQKYLELALEAHIRVGMR